MSSSLTGNKLSIHGYVVCAEGSRSRCLVISSLRDSKVNLCFKYLKQGVNSTVVSSFSSYGAHDNEARRRDYGDGSVATYGRYRDGPFLCDVHRVASPSSPHTPFSAACAGPSNATTEEFDLVSDSESDHEPEPDSDSLLEAASTNQQKQVLKEAASPLLSVPSESLEPESWMLIDGDDVPHLVSSLPLTKRYAPRRLLEFVTKNFDPNMFSPAQLKSALMFWKKKEKLQEDTSFAASAFGEKGVSQLHQWTATELTLQHARLSRIARDIFYLVLACSLLGFVRVLEAVLAAFSSSPPHYSKLLEAANSLDFFTMAFLAHSLRKPIIGILRVDPTNLDDVVQLKAKIWDEMHKFYERQWKVVATLGVGRLLALIAQKLPATNSMTRNVKMGWDFLLALPIF